MKQNTLLGEIAMIATLISILLAAYLYYGTTYTEPPADSLILGITLITIATVFLIAGVLARLRAWEPLQRAEYRLTPHVIELYQKDIHLKIAHFILILFVFVTYIVAFDLLFLHTIDRAILLPAWVIFFGIALDALYYSLKRMLRYIDPTSVVGLFTHAATINIQNEQQRELCQWIDSLFEIAMRALGRTSTSLCNHVCDELQRITRLFLDSSKSITHKIEGSGPGGSHDEISYTLFFVLQRLEVINNKAIEMHLEPICSNLVTNVGKIDIAAAKLDLSLATYPLPFLGRFALSAQRAGLTEVGPKSIITLLQVARTIVNEVDLTYAELQDPFFTLVNQIYEISKETFRQDKTMNVKVLLQPFYDLKELFQKDRIANHVDTPAIQQHIDRYISEFQALDAVLRTMPSMAPVSDTEATTA